LNSSVLINFLGCSDGRFAEAVLKAVKGEKGIVQPSFVYLSGVPGGDAVQKSVDGLDYFSTNVELGVSSLVFFRASY
jgi:malate dehydrogenase